MGARVRSLINGEFIDGTGDRIELIDPFTEKTLGSYLDAGRDLACGACKAAQKAQRVWAGLAAAARAQTLQEVARMLTLYAEPLVILEALSAGKPIRDCRTESAKVAEMFSYYSGWADKLHGEVIPVPSGHLNYTKREPLGVVLQITPWNAPIFTAGWQIVPALATGNGVVIKPGELTPITTLALVHLAERAGLPKGLVNVLCGLGPTAAQAAIKHPAVRKVVFMGSPEMGRLVAETAARALKPALLELGGKSANIVFADANLEHACLGAQAAQTEIFGPVVATFPFDTEEEVIALANASEFGLAGAVWTADVGRAHRVADQVRAGTFWINSYKAIHVSSPFGGSLKSGFGRSSGKDALMAYTCAKSIWLDNARTPQIAFGYVG